jgi:hypothetical protein
VTNEIKQQRQKKREIKLKMTRWDNAEKVEIFVFLKENS